MKQRIITALLGLVVFFTILFCFDSIIYDIAICIVSLIAVHELLLATKCTKSIPLTVAFMIGAVMPFIYPVRDIDGHSKVLFWYIWGAVLFLIAVIAIVINTISSKKISFKQHLFGFLTIVIVPSLFYVLLMLRNEFGHYQGLYYTLLIFACSWGADTGAYFAGRFLGKRKLAPKISPNKTVEGVYGGVASCLFFISLITVLYYFIMKSQGQVVQINYFTLIFVGIFGSLSGVLGDLTASAIKRQCQIKDFGSIMPGHGGVLDRFDSVLLVAPFIFIVLKILTV
ncbi:MAG: phosphatidate cytidylyltransferase [Oscillospiraceae bacterium]